MRVELNDNQKAKVQKYLDVALKRRGVQAAEHITALLLLMEKKDDLWLERSDDIQKFTTYLDDATREFGISEVQDITVIILKISEALKKKQMDLEAGRVAEPSKIDTSKLPPIPATTGDGPKMNVTGDGSN